ncbi:MAG TPA: VTT domain-containing protein [Candidatus Acidoferrum sp.]|jgi:membrane protein DedA with SNARE-associated domain/rhodanese-related sulfurtransferase|nr:VTT domain-containing protein [Candidatus Acidoferrum sp.]
MTEMLQFVIRHGYMLVFAWVFVEQAGLPVPSAPLLLAAGALSGMHRMNLGLAVAFAVFGAVASDSMWYEIGRLKGVRVLQWICRISLEPDSCVRRTQVSFARNGPRVLLGAKFIPGLNAMAAPLAGIIKMGWRRFLLFDIMGTLAWVGSFAISGFLFSGELERVAASAAFLGKWLVVLLLAAFTGYILWKFYNRQKFLRKLKIARITPEELKGKIDAGEDILVVDLRHSLDFDANPETIPGALHIDAAELEEAYEVIPRDREIVLFCACPNEATAARLALLLRSKGITQIRPLSEGYEGWRSRGFPLSLAKDETGNVEPAKA